MKTEIIIKQRALVRVGQVWEDCDPRIQVRRRRLRVRALEPEVLPTYAVCVPAVPLKDFRTSRIRLDRFRSLASGYRLVSDPEKVGVYLNGELSLHAIVDGLLEPRPPVFGKQDALDIVVPSGVQAITFAGLIYAPATQVKAVRDEPPKGGDTSKDDDATRPDGPAGQSQKGA